MTHSSRRRPFGGPFFSLKPVGRVIAALAGGVALALAMGAPSGTATAEGTSVEIALFTSNMLGHMSVDGDGGLHGVLGEYLAKLGVRAGVRFVGVIAPAVRSEREVQARRDACWAAVVQTADRADKFSWPVLYTPTSVVVATRPDSTLDWTDVQRAGGDRLLAPTGVAATTLTQRHIPFTPTRDFVEALRLVELGVADALAVTSVVLANSEASHRYRVVERFPPQASGLACNLDLDPTVRQRLSDAAAALVDDPLWRRVLSSRP